MKNAHPIVVKRVRDSMMIFLKTVFLTLINSKVLWRHMGLLILWYSALIATNFHTQISAFYKWLLQSDLHLNSNLLVNAKISKSLRDVIIRPLHQCFISSQTLYFFINFWGKENRSELSIRFHFSILHCLTLSASKSFLQLHVKKKLKQHYQVCYIFSKLKTFMQYALERMLKESYESNIQAY